MSNTTNKQRKNNAVAVEGFFLREAVQVLVAAVISILVAQWVCW
jgi:hypothetical protein